MAEKWLKIENVGIAPTESFTLLGASTTRGSDNKNLIGKFGSGNKHGITTLLRHGLYPIVFCGNLRLEFSVRNQSVKDGIQATNFNRVVVKYGGKDESGASKSSTEDLGFVLEYGATDWPHPSLAMREFVSNSIDRCIKEGEHQFRSKFMTQQETYDPDAIKAAVEEYRKTATDFKNVKVEIVDNVRAKEGTTRVFIPLDHSSVEKFYNDLGKWFLHFSEPESVNKAILPKRDRNLTDAKVAVIYRRGVRVREFISYSVESLFDYNLEDLELDESRRVDDWASMEAAGRELAKADPKELEVYLRSFVDTTETPVKQRWEHGFSSHSLSVGLRGDKQELIKSNWKKAFRAVAGSNGVLSGKYSSDAVSRKGFNPLVVSDSLLTAAREIGLRTPESVLSEDDLDGREIFDATHDVKLALDFWWNKISSLGLANGKDKPAAKSFSSVMDGGTVSVGFYRGNTIYVNLSVAGTNQKSESASGLSQDLMAVVLEEIAHHVTGASDMSRDLQDFTFNLASKMALAGIN